MHHDGEFQNCLNASKSTKAIHRSRIHETMFHRSSSNTFPTLSKPAIIYSPNRQPSIKCTHYRAPIIRIGKRYMQANQTRANEAIAFSIALNETTDISDTAQVVFCYRAVNKSFQIITDVLTLKALHNQTRASDIMDTFEIVKNEFQLDMQKCVSVATDGAPNMIGNNISCHQHIQMT